MISYLFSSSIALLLFCQCISQDTHHARLQTKQRLADAQFSEIILIWNPVFIESGIFGSTRLQDDALQNLSGRMQDALVHRLRAITTIPLTSPETTNAPPDWIDGLPPEIWYCAFSSEFSCSQKYRPPYIALKGKGNRGILFVNAEYRKSSPAAKVITFLLLPLAALSFGPNNLSLWTVHLRLLLLDQEGNVVTSAADFRDGFISGSWELHEMQIRQLLKSSLLTSEL